MIKTVSSFPHILSLLISIGQYKIENNKVKGFFILYYGAGYVNVLQLLMVAGLTIYMNMSIHNN